jgi:glycogen(starch) synthase
VRILHWTESFWPRIGGAEVFARLLARDSQRRGHECLVVTDTAAGLPPDGRVDGLAIKRFPFQAALAARDIDAVTSLGTRAKGLLREFAPHVIHLHTAQPGAFFYLRAHRAVPVPSVFTTHDLVPSSGRDSPLLAQVLGTARRVVGISSAMVARTIDAFPEIAPRTVQITPGLPMPATSPSSLPWAPPVLLGIGRLTPEKGFDLFLRALPPLVRAVPDLKAVIAGDGPARAGLEVLASTLGIEARVRFLGWVEPEDIPGLIDGATAVVVPSRWQEPFGLVAVQAMQMARPVVAARIGGLPEAVRHEETGLLVPPDDPDALGQALAYLLSHPEQAIAWGENGRAHARIAFGWSRCASEYDAVYAEATR